MDGMNPEPGDKGDRAAEALLSLEPGLEDGTETHSPRLLNAEAGRFLHRKPSLARGEDRNGERVHRHAVTHTCPKWKSQHRDTEEEFFIWRVEDSREPEEVAAKQKAFYPFKADIQS